MLFSNLLAIMPFVASTLGKPVEARTVTDFTMYAYGSGKITGLPVISINSTVYISSYTPEQISSDAHNVTCRLTSEAIYVHTADRQIVEAFATRGNFTATIENGGQSLFYVPSTSGAVGFTNDTDDSSLITTGFGFYGHVIFLQTGSTMLTEWYAVPTDNGSIWTLSWNDEADGIPIALRSISPF